MQYGVYGKIWFKERTIEWIFQVWIRTDNPAYSEYSFVGRWKRDLCGVFSDGSIETRWHPRKASYVELGGPFPSQSVVINHPKPPSLYYPFLATCIVPGIVDWSTAVETVHSSIDLSYAIRARSRSSRSRKTSPCGFHKRRAVPQ